MNKMMMRVRCAAKWPEAAPAPRMMVRGRTLNAWRFKPRRCVRFL